MLVVRWKVAEIGFPASLAVFDVVLNYIGSIAIDEKLMKNAKIVENEKVLVVNLTNGQRWETYAIYAKEGSKTISPNGGSALLCVPGDILVIMSFAYINQNKHVTPKIVILNEKNEIISNKRTKK